MVTPTPSQSSADEQAHHQLVVDRVLKHLRLAKAKRTLRTRLGLASFKASRGWQDIAFEEIEPHLLRSSRPQSEEQQQQSELDQPLPRQHRSRTAIESHPYRRPTTTSTPEHQHQSSYRSEPEPTTFIQLTPPEQPAYSSTQPSAYQPRSLAPPQTPEQMIRSNWTSRNQVNEDNDLTDQTTAAELMLFLATGSPSPDHRLKSATNIHHAVHRSQQRF